MKATVNRDFFEMRMSHSLLVLSFVQRYAVGWHAGL
jgi:hypothetical protein